MKRTNERRVFQNLWTMKTNSSWIKTDYHVQTFVGFLGIVLLPLSLVSFLLSTEAAMIFVCLAILALIPIGVWQVISGVFYALNGDRLQQIYLGVVAFYFSIWYLAIKSDTDCAIPLMAIAVTIAVWKYTVVRADYISLDIIDVPKLEIEELLDA
jgi:uncharacterized membrane protein YpjA